MLRNPRKDGTSRKLKDKKYRCFLDMVPNGLTRQRMEPIGEGLCPENGKQSNDYEKKNNRLSPNDFVHSGDVDHSLLISAKINTQVRSPKI